MVRKRSVVILSIILIVITAFTTYAVTSLQYLKINNVKRLIHKYYVDDVDDAILMEGAAAGVAAAVKDPYTGYLDKTEFRDFLTKAEGGYAGIGVLVGINKEDMSIMVITPFKGSPGEKAGILPGDRIIKVDDKDVSIDEYDNLVNMMRGPEGTDVTLTIVRENVDEPISITVTREDINIPTVASEVMDNDIGYIAITMFDGNTGIDFNNALDELYDKNIKGLIIDLRGNPGGLMDAVVEVADRLVPKGVIVYTEDKNGNKEYHYSDETEINIPLVLLVDGNSASASEVLSGAVRDYNKGILIGTTTFGKGVVQTIIPFRDNTGLRVTIAKYYTPNGICIHGEGLKPDIEVEIPKDKLPITDIKDDIQLNKAIEVIKEQI